MRFAGHTDVNLASTVVRLRGAFIACLATWPRGFNSILVRLKALFSTVVFSLLMDFNSILVRLKVEVRGVLKKHWPIEFQFHTGWIKSRHSQRAYSQDIRSFNSPLVRLKAGVSKTITYIHLFQFHSGSIKG